MTTKKKQVNTIEIDRPLHFTITENKRKFRVEESDYNTLLEIIQGIDESKYPDGIPGKIIAEKLCDQYPDLYAKMFRPTGKYYKRYMLVLKVLARQELIEYYKDGSIRKLPKLKKEKPKKKGLDKWEK